MICTHHQINVHLFETIVHMYICRGICVNLINYKIVSNKCALTWLLSTTGSSLCLRTPAYCITSRDFLIHWCDWLSG
jgi:hypothetical protein